MYVRFICHLDVWTFGRQGRNEPPLTLVVFKLTEVAADVKPNYNVSDT